MPLTINDFNYSNDVKEYMQMFFDPELTNNKIKEIFDFQKEWPPKPQNQILKLK